MRSVGARESGRAAGLGEEEWETARRGAVYKEAGRGRVVRSTSRRGAEGARGGRGGRSGAAGPPGAKTGVQPCPSSGRHRRRRER
ncbi:hypothetical protein PAHAL_8G048400 [Panicum hallii]|uniref:Uncharacterized protein n=1 Tax=Panicum hallii TaxID=206008 RepID=A0A2T8I7R7_9POAL|nr:hypothetical protein PAHAL_8G048400 [Panicum hallii]